MNKRALVTRQISAVALKSIGPCVYAQAQAMLAAAGPRPHHLSSERAICSLAEANMVLNDWSLLKAEAVSATGVRLVGELAGE